MVVLVKSNKQVMSEVSVKFLSINQDNNFFVLFSFFVCFFFFCYQFLWFIRPGNLDLRANDVIHCKG